MKLEEMNGWELMTALAEIADPVGNMVNDEALWECFIECTRKGVRIQQKDGLRFILQTYSSLFPLLFRDHKEDVARMLSAIEGRPIEETMRMNGKELFEDFQAVYKEYLEPFFTKFALSARKK